MHPSLKACGTTLRRPSPPVRIAGIALVAIAMLLSAGCGVLRGHEAPSAYVDDATITARVKTALIKTPGVKASEIDVHTYRGVVTLNGMVDDEQMLTRATKIARDTPGVASVHNSLQVARAEPLAERR